MIDKSNAFINIISFGIEPSTASVCDALERLGNPVKSLNPELWLGSQSTYTPNVNVLVLTARWLINEQLHDNIVRKNIRITQSGPVLHSNYR